MGVDVGGSGIKGGIVDLTTGELAGDRLKVLTPQPATPGAISAAIAGLVRTAGWSGPVGCALPSVIKNGVTRTAANIDASWVGIAGDEVLSAAVGAPVTLINDADAAGVAEMRWGAGAGVSGTVLLLTFGTGIGSALFTDGVLVPNTELGHLQMWGDSAEKRASAKARERLGMSFEEWADVVSEFLAYVEWMLSPDTIIVGGGVSKKHELFLHLLRADASLLPASLKNNAGIAGAALHAAEGAI
jgi:polyphosphate glucokinase